MKISRLIEQLRQFDDNIEVCILCGYNIYRFDFDNLFYNKKQQMIMIDLSVDDVNNEIGDKK